MAKPKLSPEDRALKELTFARLRPYNPRKGFLVESFTHNNGMSFEGGDVPVWYIVDEEFGEELSEIKQEPADPDSMLPMFQVVNGLKQKELAESETQNALIRLQAAAVTDKIPKAHVEDRQSKPAGGRAAAVPEDKPAPAPEPIPESAPAPAAKPAPAPVTPPLPEPKPTVPAGAPGK
jgi:hypothetical protein